LGAEQVTYFFIAAFDILFISGGRHVGVQRLSHVFLKGFKHRTAAHHRVLFKAQSVAYLYIRLGKIRED
jgi:hypothetical protein